MKYLSASVPRVVTGFGTDVFSVHLSNMRAIYAFLSGYASTGFMDYKACFNAESW